MRFIRFIARHWKTLTLGVGLLAFAGISFAQGPAAAASETLRGFAQILSLFINLFTFLALKLIELGGRLMGSDFIIGDTAMAGLRPIWQNVRNITYIGFVVVLLGLAFTNLFQVSNWQIKDKLPRVILALVLINFSLPAMRIAISGIDAATMGVMSFASPSLAEFGASSTEDILLSRSDKRGQPCYTDNDDCQSFEDKINDYFCKGGSGVGSCWFEIKSENAQSTTSTSANANNLFLAFGVYFQQLQQLPLISAELDNGLQSWTEVAQDTLFAAIMGIVYLVALVMMFIALLARMVVLWLAIAASPILIAALVMGIGTPGDLGAKFQTMLLLPLKVAAAMTVSFIMMAGMTDTLIATEAGAFVQVGSGVFSTAAYGFLWQILTVVVFWGAVKWAVADTGIDQVNGIMNSIIGGTSGLGKFLTDALIVNRPMFSVKDASGNNSVDVSLGSLKTLPSQIQRMETNRAAGQDKKMREFFNLSNDANEYVVQQTESLKNREAEFKDADEASKVLHEFTNRVGRNNMNDADVKQWKDQYRGRIASSNIANKEAALTQLDQIFSGQRSGETDYQTFARTLGSASYGGAAYSATKQATVKSVTAPKKAAATHTIHSTSRVEPGYVALDVNDVANNTNLPYEPIITNVAALNQFLSGAVPDSQGQTLSDKGAQLAVFNYLAKRENIDTLEQSMGVRLRADINTQQFRDAGPLPAAD